MAKRVIKPIVKKALKESTLNKDIEILEAALENKTPPVVDTPIEAPTIIETPIVESLPVIEAPVTNEISEPAKLSIWDDIKKVTEEDANIKEPSALTESINNLGEDANEIDTYTEEQARKQSYKVKAGMIVELLDVVFMIICTLITFDFSDENQKKFTLNKERKKAIQFNLYQLYELQGKKVDPKKAIWGLVIGSYLPMLIVALITMFNKFKQKKEAKEAKVIMLQNEEQNRYNLQIERENNEILMNRIKNLENENSKIKTNSLTQKNEGKIKKEKPPVFIHTEIKKRGRKAGVKVGSYNKKK